VILVCVWVPDETFAGMVLFECPAGSASVISALTAVWVCVPAPWVDALSPAASVTQSSWNRRMNGDTMEVYLGMTAQDFSLGS
jgi:hypothetical protein